MSGVWAVAKVKKLDNGYRGQIINESRRGLWEVGEQIFNRQLHPFPKGSLLFVTIRFSKTGRKMVQDVKLIAEGGDVTGEELVEEAIKAGRTEETASEEVIEGHERIVKDAYRVAEKGEPAPYPDETAHAAARVVREVKEKTVVRRRASLTEGYYVSPEARLVFNTVSAVSNSRPDRAVKVMMVGASGYGKTTLPRLVADLLNKSYLRINCATVRDPEEWFGYREVRDGATVFIRSEFAKAIEKGNLVVVLDEFNRLEPWLHNTLFPLLDDDGATVVHDEKFSIGPGVIVVGTINTGYKYTGTFELDEALLNRFEFILEVGPIPADEEEKVLVQRTGVGSDDAKAIVRMANILRQSEVVCSTRTSLLVAGMVTAGMTIREAFESAVVRRLGNDSAGSSLRKQVIDLVNVQFGPYLVRTLANDIFGGGNPEEVVIKDAPEGQVAHHLELEKKGSYDPAKRIKLIIALRRLPVLRDEKVVSLSLDEAQDIREQLEDGKRAKITLAEKPENLEELIETLRQVGVGGRYFSQREVE